MSLTRPGSRLRANRTMQPQGPARRLPALWVLLLLALAAPGCAATAPARSDVPSRPPSAPSAPRSASGGSSAGVPTGSPAAAQQPTAAAPPPLASDPTGEDRSEEALAELGALVCMGHGAHCGAAWEKGLQQGARFNQLIPKACLHVYLRETDDEGIACAERAIRLVGALPERELVAGQFAPGERKRHPVWHNQSDQAWSLAARRYFDRILAFCDQATPVIYDYFPCLLREVQFFQAVLKGRRMN